jgi:tetrapyrrole methylase family protein/MazG family protein
MSSTQNQTGERFERLRDTIARLRAPGGCPWDREQTHASIARNLVEEAYEAVDAIEAGNVSDMREELGDVLLQVVFQAQMAAEADEFTLDDVIEGITNKMVRRHPHVFGDEAAFAAAGLSAEQIERIKAVNDPQSVLDLWDQIKLAEKANKAQRAIKIAPTETDDPVGAVLTARPQGLLDGIPRSMPALMQAQDISRKAVAAGFEWESIEDIWTAVLSEVEEFKEAAPASEHASEEFGDILFTLVNVARREGIDAESALRAACGKFRARWAMMEQYAAQSGKTINEYGVEQQEAWWQQAKRDLQKEEQ